MFHWKEMFFRTFFYNKWAECFLKDRKRQIYFVQKLSDYRSRQLFLVQNHIHNYLYKDLLIK
jgi:hypothetical protein